jgi:catechol 2,3-dioxygenase-like lactoylglutathione lyase family enzyme
VLQHVALEVRPEEVEACVGFWRLLGFAPVPVPDTLAGTTTWVQRGSGQVHLLHTASPVTPPQGHCAVVVEDYEEAVRELERAGYQCDARFEHWGAPRSFVRDPAGHRVEFMAAPPPGPSITSSPSG